MENDIIEIGDNLKSIIQIEIPDSKSGMMEFISSLDIRFPEFPKTIRSIFEVVYQEKFNEKFIW